MNADREKQMLEKKELNEGSSDGYVVEDDNSSVQQISDRKLTWIEASLLLLTEYVVLAILAFPSSFAILGMAGGTIATLVIGLSTLYTSHILWRYCMLHPEIRDICDAAFILAGRKRWAWVVAFIGLALNNYAIMGLHVVAGTTAIQTIRDNSITCNMIWAGMLFAIMFILSLARDFKYMSAIGIIASGTMFVCVLLVLIGHGIQGTPNGFTDTLGPVTTTVWAPKGTTFVQGMSALLNITYTWVGQALIPSFVGDMEHPEDFPKALYLSMAAEFCLFTITGATVYHYAGTAYTVAPGYGSLIRKYGRPAAGLVMPTIIIVGMLYSIVTSRAIFFQVFKAGSKHRTRHTVKGWSVWIAIVFGGWVISFFIGEAVPFFNDLLSLISSLFDSWFGYILWGFAWYEIYKGRSRDGPYRIFENIMSFLMIVTGVFFFVAGTYASAVSIKNSYAAGAVKKPLSCADTGFTFTR